MCFCRHRKTPVLYVGIFSVILLFLSFAIVALTFNLMLNENLLITLIETQGSDT